VTERWQWPIARLANPISGKICGAGVLCLGDVVVTCAHVVDEVLAGVETPMAWPPYVPPVDLPWITQGDLWFQIEAPAGAVVGDEWTLRIVATNRAGAAATGFGDSARVGLTIEGTDGAGTWTGFEHLELASGGAIDVTAGWTAGVWQAQVRATEAAGAVALRLTVTFDAAARDRAELELAELAELAVELPPGGVTPGVPFRVLVAALDGDGLPLAFFSGRTVTLAWDDGEEGALTVADAAGTGFDYRGWEDGIGEWQALLADRGEAEELRLQALIGGAAEGEDTALIVERFTVLWPEHAQAFQERTLELRAFDAALAPRTDFDGTGYTLGIEGYDAAEDEWAAWDGLVTVPDGTAPDVAAGWQDGV
jgi:hypothetical protein